jgi:putative acetyltransferase
MGKFFLTHELSAVLVACGDHFVMSNARGAGAALDESIGNAVLRDAGDADAAAIVALVGDVWSEYPGKVLDPARDMPELLAPASTYAAWDGRFWVVEGDEGRLLGTIAVKPTSTPGVVELQKLYVAKGARRTGLGAMLCGLVEREARRRGAHTVELWSDVKLLDAHRLYQRLGYARGAELKRYDDTSSTIRCYYSKDVAGGALAAPTMLRVHRAAEVAP